MRRVEIAAWILTGIVLVAVLYLHLLPALLAGLLVYELVHVIEPRLPFVQGSRGTKSSAVASDVKNSTKANPGHGRLKKSFTSLNGVSADLTGAQIVDLATKGNISAITPDAPMAASDSTSTSTTTCSACPYEGTYWPWITGVIYDATGTYSIAFWIAAGCNLISILAIWLAAPRKVRAVAGRAGTLVVG